MKSVNSGCSIEEALESFTSFIKRIDETKELPLAAALGRIAAADIKAENDIPAFDRSAMDGYAVRAEDITGAREGAPASLKVAGRIYAGEAPDIKCLPHTAVRVMTGAFIPEGYDAVVKQEDTDLGKEEVKIFASVKKGMNCSFAGEEMKKGDAVIKAMTRLKRTDLFRLASAGYGAVTVQRKPKACVISTGSELTAPGTPLEKGKIYEGISVLLAASLTEAGFEADAVIVEDEESLIAYALKKAVNEADFIITTGGVSVGEKDLIPGVMEKLGAEMIFQRADIQPGTPTCGFILNEKPVLSLSGNPYAALANFDWYFPGVAAALTGCEEYEKSMTKAVLDDDYEKVNVHRRMVRACCKNGRVTIPSKTHFASSLFGISDCNCYLIVPAGSRIKKGDTVDIYMM